MLKSRKIQIYIAGISFLLSCLLFISFKYITWKPLLNNLLLILIFLLLASVGIWTLYILYKFETTELFYKIKI